MIAFLRTISAVLFASLVLAIGVFLVLDEVATLATTTAVLVACALVGILFTIPFLAIYLFHTHRMEEIRELADAARTIASAEGDPPSIAGDYGGTVAELARGLDMLRLALRRRVTLVDEQRFTMERIINGFQEGLLAINADRRIVLANARFRELFRVGEIIGGRPYFEVVRTMSLISAFDRALEGSDSRDRVTLTAGGTQRRIEMRVFPVSGSAEIAAVALFIDVTQIERLESVRREFLDDFSHEVRTPLAGLRGALETLEGGGLAETDERSLWGVVERQLGRLEALVRDLAELTRIESGDLELELQPVDLKSLLSDLAVDFESRTGRSVPVRGERVVALADAARIQRVFSNLIDNAFKHGGGSAEVEVDASDDFAIVRVRDFGPGIPPEERERVFHRFYRVDKSRAQTVPGTGLGLAISKHLTLLHGGSISVSGEGGGGAVFEVRLPRVKGPSHA